ncbi:MAG TPA: aminomethyltransferase family protein [Verrucomicrobiae bacterium]|jgi:aminomethyltransferase|nr:aminomethyltransferase family protein [Verrucomicrobiae bacterium]
MPIGTAFHPRTSALCLSHNWRVWSGYLAASSYEVLHDHEYHAIRNSAALIDISPLYKYDVAGRDALKFVDRVVTRDAGKCARGQAMYTCLCDTEGKVIQDGTFFRWEENRFRFHLAEPGLRWLRMNAGGMEVEIEEVSEKVAAVALQGPTSREIVKAIFGPAVDRLRFFRFISFERGGIHVVLSRTGYTGDLGYELWVPAERAIELWDILIEAGKPYGITPAGMLALDIARLEAGFILLEVDYTSTEKALIPSQKYSPFEIGLGWTVTLEKENFVGRKALLEERRGGPARGLVGLEVDWHDYERLYREVGLAPELPFAAWRGGTPVYAGGKQVGQATTGGWSPTIKRYIALATVQSGFARAGTELFMEVTIDYVRKKVKARVVKTPFFDPPRKRVDFSQTRSGLQGQAPSPPT